MKIEFTNDDEKKLIVMSFAILVDLCNAAKKMNNAEALLSTLPLMILARKSLKAIGFEDEAVNKAFAATSMAATCDALGVGLQGNNSKFDFSTIEPLNKPRG